MALNFTFFQTLKIRIKILTTELHRVAVRNINLTSKLLLELRVSA